MNQAKAKQHNKKATNLSKYEWMFFAKSYLSLARIGLEELKSQQYASKTSFEDIFCYENQWLLIAIIYNIKHAMELIVKSLGISIDKKYLPLHNPQTLIKDLKNTIPKITKASKPEELAKLIFKYYKCEFWNKKIIKNSSVVDCQNDIFRFPDNTAGFHLNLEIFKDVSFKEKEELLKDIRRLEKLLGILNSQITSVKHIRPDKE